MQLLTNEVKKLIPPLYSQENEKNPTLYVKFFMPDSSWTWYVAEGELDDDFLFFGYVIGVESEWGFFSLRELERGRGGWDLPVERDRWFTPTPWDVIEKRGQ